MVQALGYELFDVVSRQSSIQEDVSIATPRYP